MPASSGEQPAAGDDDDDGIVAAPSDLACRYTAVSSLVIRYSRIPCAETAYLQNMLKKVVETLATYRLQAPPEEGPEGTTPEDEAAVEECPVEAEDGAATGAGVAVELEAPPLELEASQPEK